jgi:hypothetical protein
LQEISQFLLSWKATRKTIFYALLNYRTYDLHSLEEDWEIREVREKEMLLFSIMETENQTKYR